MYRSSRQCPVCGGRFEIHRTKSYSYERCTGCLGVWVEYGVVRDMVAELVPELTFELEEARGARSRSCPDCRTTMGHYQFARIPLDACTERGHGVWFDKDELTHVLARAGQDEHDPPPPPTSMTSLLNDFFSGRKS